MNPKYDPWFKATFPLKVPGADLKLHVPHDVFSTMQIDEGTLLILEHLPERAPEYILDMGCGYGALGLPIAARFPNAKIDMVDRDLLATMWSARNAEVNGLTNARVYGSLGYRDVKPERSNYDWILCNIPARIGRPFIEHFLAAGRAMLSEHGELCIVVIRDLGPLVEELAAEHKWPVRETGRGPRHVIYALAADKNAKPLAEPRDLYLRDTVEVGGLKLERPFDIGGDDPKRLASGLPVLLDALPKRAPKSVLCFRCGYGALPLTARARWPEAAVTAMDRDLLGTTYTRRNAERLKLDDKLTVLEGVNIGDTVKGSFELIIGEISPSAAERVAAAEIKAIAGLLAPGGQALLLALDKLATTWIPAIAAKHKFSISKLIGRDGYAVLRMAK